MRLGALLRRRDCFQTVLAPLVKSGQALGTRQSARHTSNTWAERKKDKKGRKEKADSANTHR